MSRTPKPCVHAAHGGAHDEAEVVDFEAGGDELVFGFDHVGVAVGGELGVETVAGFAAAAVADVVGEDEEELAAVERLAGVEEFAGKLGSEKFAPLPVVPWRMRMALVVWPWASCWGVPRVRKWMRREGRDSPEAKWKFGMV